MCHIITIWCSLFSYNCKIAKQNNKTSHAGMFLLWLLNMLFKVFSSRSLFRYLKTAFRKYFQYKLMSKVLRYMEISAY